MTTDRRRVHIALAVAVVAVIATAAGLYLELARRSESLSSTGAATIPMPPGAPGAPASGTTRTAAPAIEVSAERLAQRLKEKGGSAEDWALLARSYVQMRRFPEAVDAFSRALEKSPDNAAFLAEQAAARKAATGDPAPR